VAVQGKRLPAEYVIAFVDDPAIDWPASCARLGVEPGDDARAAGQTAYADVRAVPVLPLVALPGETITVAVCRPLTHAEFIAARERYLEDVTDQQADANGRRVVRDLVGYCRALCDLVVLRVEGLEPAPYESPEDLTQEQIVELGATIARLNSLSAEVRVF